MRIAAYVAGYEPEAGGGYTFESDVLAALINVAGKQPSPEVCLLCPARQVDALSGRLKGTGIDILSVTQGALERRLNILVSEFWLSESALAPAQCA